MTWNGDKYPGDVSKFLAMSNSPGLKHIQLIIWLNVSTQAFSKTCSDNVTCKMKHKDIIWERDISLSLSIPPAGKKLCISVYWKTWIESLRGYIHLENIHMYIALSHTHAHRLYITIWYPGALSKWRQFSGNSPIAVIKHYRHATGKLHECIIKPCNEQTRIFFVSAGLKVITVKYFPDELEVNDNERAVGPRGRLCNSHMYTAELSSPSKQQQHTTLRSRGCLFDQGYES